jgi:GT2 family glycosyltransferase
MLSSPDIRAAVPVSRDSITNEAPAVEPLVFVVLVNWNGKALTLECLESLATISYTNHRIVVVDNGSTDGSVQAIGAAFPHVPVLEMEQNLRFAGGSNAGMRYALKHGADCVLLLNNDTVVDRDFLSFLVARLQADPSAGMVAPKIYYHEEPNRIWFAGGSISMWRGTMRHIGIRELDDGRFDAPREIEYASGCCILTARSVVERIGMLDESFFMYTEDADWSLRCRRAGFRIIYEPRARVWHKLSVSAGGHLSAFKLRNKFLSNFRFFRRYAAWYQWPVFPWLSLLTNGLATLRYLFTRRH